MSETLRVLITVKTYPIPSASYDELVCTAGINDAGEFIRLYPINFRDLPFSQQYRKYQWIEVEAEKHRGRDSRKESWRPYCDTLRVGAQLATGGPQWQDRAPHVLPLASRSMEELRDMQTADRTSLGILRPKEILDLEVTADDADWNPRFIQELKQARLWENRTVSKTPPRKVPWKFHYHFSCDDPRCTGHRMMIEDWEVGALYWREVDGGKSPQEAAQSVRGKFLDQICGPDRDTHFFVGTVLAHGTWVIIGAYWPKIQDRVSLPLFDG